MAKQKSQNVLAATALREHFGQLRLEQLVTASRTFPITSRVDLQLALETKFRELRTSPMGVHVQFAHETTTIAHLLHDGHNPVVIGPLQHDEVDIGDITATSPQGLVISPGPGRPERSSRSTASR